MLIWRNGVTKHCCFFSFSRFCARGFAFLPFCLLPFCLYVPLVCPGFCLFALLPFGLFAPLVCPGFCLFAFLPFAFLPFVPLVCPVFCLFAFLPFAFLPFCAACVTGVLPFPFLSRLRARGFAFLDLLPFAFLFFCPACVPSVCCLFAFLPFVFCSVCLTARSLDRSVARSLGRVVVGPTFGKSPFLGNVIMKEEHRRRWGGSQWNRFCLPPGDGAKRRGAGGVRGSGKGGRGRGEG